MDKDILRKKYRVISKQDRRNYPKAATARLTEEEHKKVVIESSKLSISMSSVLRILLLAWLRGDIQIQFSVKGVGK